MQTDADKILSITSIKSITCHCGKTCYHVPYDEDPPQCIQCAHCGAIALNDPEEEMTWN